MQAGGGAESTGRLPDFVVIGAPKAGTTSLFFHLKHHADVWLPPRKELHFFSNHFDRGVDWYGEQFAAAGAAQRAGEMTPEYLDHPKALERMAGVLTDVKLIAILRHPVERAYSHYQMQMAAVPNAVSFTEVLDHELDGGAANVPHPHYPYLRAGRYYEHLQRLRAHYPESALLVLLMDDLANDPEGTYRALCNHIGVSADQPPPDLERRYNRTLPVRSAAARRLMVKLKVEQRLPRKAALMLGAFNVKREGYAAIDVATRRRLLDYYEEQTTSLATMLDRDLSGWLV